MRARLLALVLMTALAACSEDDSTQQVTPPSVSSTLSATPSPTTSPTQSPTASPHATAGPTSSPAPRPTPVRVTVRTITAGLEVPWGLAFLPDGSALVSERDSARIHQVRASGSRSVVATVPGVAPGGEGGLLGLAVSRTYASDKWVYAYYTAASDNRVVRFRLASPAQQQMLVIGIPKAGNHNGGRLAFGPDGMLYAGTGDAGEPSRSQITTSLGGKILRLRPTGGAAAGNPFGNTVWSMGHRNVQGLAFDSAGRLWATEFGQNTWDEVNLIARGKNYGWPVVEGEGTGGGKYVSPKVVWRTSEASPSGVAYGGGELHVAALRGTRLWDVPLSGTSVGSPVSRYQATFGRIRTAVLEPGGTALWITTSNCDGRGSCGSSKDRVIRVPL